MDLQFIIRPLQLNLVIWILLLWCSQSYASGPGTLKWKYATNEPWGVRALTVDAGSDGIVYFTNDDDFFALNPDGTIRWKYAIGDWAHSTPAIGTDGTIYFTTQHGEALALNPDGTLKWKYEIFLGGDKTSPAVSPDGTVYIVAEGDLYALNSNGMLKWEYEVSKNRVENSPVIGTDGTVYIGTEQGYLFALNSDGTLKWKYEINENALAGETADGISTTAAIGQNGSICFASKLGYIFSLNPDGILRFKYNTGSSFGSGFPIIDANGGIYFESWNDEIFALNPDGSIKWKYKAEIGDGEYDGWGSPTPAIGNDGTIYFGSKDSYIHSLSPDGILKWKFKIGNDISGPESSDCIMSFPAIGPDGTVYIGSADNYLYAINEGTNYYAPVFKSSSSNVSAIGISNLSKSSLANIDIKIYSQTGTVLKTEQKTIPAYGQDAFLIGQALNDKGWIKLSSSQKLAGLTSIIQNPTTPEKMVNAMALLTEGLSTELLIPHVVQNEHWDTNVYLANPNNSEATVTLIYANKGGAASVPYKTTITAYGSKEISAEVIADNNSVNGGTLTISSTKGLAIFALINNLKTGNSCYSGINAIDISDLE